MEELQKDLLEVFEKHGLKILEGSTSLELSPIHFNTMVGLSCREVVLRFTEAVFMPNDILIDYIEKHGIRFKNEPL